MPVKSLGDIIERFRLNWKDYIYDYRFYLIPTFISALADAASTVYFMCQTGPEAEGHPAIRLISYLLGPVLGPVIGKLCQFTAVIALTVYLRRQARYIFIALIILYIWAAWYNIWGCYLYYPRLLQWLEHLS